MQLLGQPEVVINGNPYRLARQELTQRTLGPSGRRWQMEQRPVTTEK